jgi:hypothetical protein
MQLTHHRKVAPRWRRTLVATLVALATLVVLPAGPASAVGTTYYFDNSSSACRDVQHASSPADPYCDFAFLDEKVMQPGDKILIKRGTTYDRSRVSLYGVGGPNPADRIVIGTYGVGEKPDISLKYYSKLIRAMMPIFRLKNPSGWEVSGLELSYAAAGLVAQYRSDYAYGSYTGNRSLEFRDLLVHHIAGVGTGRSNGGSAPHSYDCTAGQDMDMWNSSGIAITGKYSDVVPDTTWYVDGVVFRDIEGHNNFNTISVDSCDAKVGDVHSPTQPAQSHLVRHVVVDNVSSDESDGAGYAYQCGEGLRFSGVTDLRVTNSRLVAHGDCYVATGTAGVILVSVTDATFINNTITDVPRSGSGDATAIDHELWVENVRLLNNLLARNAGPGVEYLAVRCMTPDYNIGHEVRGNSFFGNHSSAFRMNQKIQDCSGTPPTKQFSGQFKGNVTADPHMLTGNGEGFEAWDVGDNQTAAPREVPHYSADEFGPLQGATGWTYQTTRHRNDPGNWVYATYVPGEHLSGVWLSSGDGAKVARFEQTGGSCLECASARVWTAPRDGRVAVRSRAVAGQGPQSSFVQVLRNFAPVAGPVPVETDDDGSELNYDLNVKAGDQLRFAVWSDNASPDVEQWVSWAPSITYVDPNKSSGTGDFADPGFETQPVSAPYVYAPDQHAWSFSPTSSIAGAGIVRRGSAFGNPNGQGNQAAFVQRAGWIQQTVSNVSPGQYRISFDLAQRAAGQLQPLRVYFGGQQVGFAQTTSTGYVRYRTPAFEADFDDGAPVTITIQGMSVTNDATAFVDQIRLEPVDDVAQPLQGGFEAPLLNVGEAKSCGSFEMAWTCHNAPNVGITATGGYYKVDNNPEGNQVAYLTESGPGTIGWLRQTVGSMVPGTYSVTFSAAQREHYEAYGRGQKVKVTVSTASDSVTTDVWPQNGRFQRYATPAITVDPGESSITITFESTQVQPDYSEPTKRWTTFLDDVRVVSATDITSTTVNPGFENPPLADNSFAYGPAAAGWRLQPSLGQGGAGISRNGSAFGSTAHSCCQVALLQRDAVIATTDDWLPAGGWYAVTVRAAQRVRGGTADKQDLRIQVDGVPYVTAWRPEGGAWETRTFAVYVPPDAKGRLEIIGINGGEDNTAFVDGIEVARLN